MKEGDHLSLKRPTLPWARFLRALKDAVKWALWPKTLYLDCYFTKTIVRRYCRGFGCEIGPGVNPQTPRKNTIYLDRYVEYLAGMPINLDVQADAMSLPFATGCLDYLVSSHALEHCPDTLRVLEEWSCALKPGGILLLRLPHRDRCFDRDRPLTSLAHHIEDYERKIGYDDQTHWQEFLDCSMPYQHAWKEDARKPDGSFDIDYIVGRGKIHYHVWTQTEMVDILRYLNFRIRYLMDDIPDRGDSFVIVE